jgi:hypothetical protein
VKALQAAMAGGDMEAVAAQFGSKVQWPKEFIRDPLRAPVDVQSIRDFVKTSFKLPELASGKPASVTVLGNEEILRAYGIKLLKVLPTSGADFRDERIVLYRQPDPTVVSFLRDYLRIEDVAARLKFVPVNPFTKRTASPVP